MKSLIKDNANIVGYAVGASAIGALTAGLVILSKKIDNLEMRLKIMLSLQQCEFLLIKGLNNECEKLSGKIDEIEEPEEVES